MDHHEKEQALMDELSHAIASMMQGEEDRPTRVDGLNLFRRDSPSEACPCLYEPGIVLVAQGAKQMLVDQYAYVYDNRHFLVTSLDIPASTQVVRATSKAPCLGLSLRLDRGIITELIAQMGLPDNGRKNKASITIGNITAELLSPMTRLLALTKEPKSIPLLAPLIIREIHYRLLTSSVAPCLWQIALVGSMSHRIAEAINWLKSHYAERISIEHFASEMQMSPSSLHHHFRQLTGMSPLQYQKRLRINKARLLMINEHLDAASASYRVGYESPSQFNREYKRLFGIPPRQDIEGILNDATMLNAYG